MSSVRSTPNGLSRFLPDRFSLDRLTAATRSSSDALQAISAERVARLRENVVAEQRRVAESQAEPGAEQ